MAHRTLKTSYSQLTDRLNRYPQGAPGNETLFAILKMLFSEKEAENWFPPCRSNLLPLKKPAASGRMSLTETAKDAGYAGGPGDPGRHRTEWRDRYVLPPPMAGFFEFSMMRMRE